MVGVEALELSGLGWLTNFGMYSGSHGGLLRTQYLGYYFRRLKHMCTRLRMYLSMSSVMHLAFGSRLLQGMNRSTNASDWTNRETCGGDEKVKRALNGSDLKPNE